MLSRSHRYDTLHASHRGPVLWIALHRPHAGNRVNRRMVTELGELAQTANLDESVRVVVLTGHGRWFSAGGEVPRVSSPDKLGAFQAAGAVARIEKPMVAAINGDALGQGLEVALAADLRVAAQTARFGLPQVREGLLPWDGGTQRLPRLVGRAQALRLLLLGETIDAAEAQRIGLVHRLAAPEALVATAEEMARGIASAAPVAARYAKEAVRQGLDLSLAQGLRLEADLALLLHTTRDRAEGIRSFLERRQPRFRGR
ncbi:MAG: enoyl-CoA hydratase/isomerase family protein [Chloroflexi bacterium]|nr:enoyl-CoA hydratase/isomerase family protein [Chloroflexota bacterium]